MKSKFKLLTLILTFILVFTLALTGCEQSKVKDEEPAVDSDKIQQAETEKNDEVSDEADDGEQKTIAFSLKTITNDDFQKAIADSIQKAVEESGNKFELVTAGDQTDVAMQVKQIEDLVTKQVDAIIVSPMDANAVIPALKKAKDANIPVVLVDQTIEGNEDLFVTYIGTDNFNAGKVGGEEVIEWLDDEGNVLIVRGANGSSAGDQRVDGFKAGLEGSNVQIVGEQAGDWKNDVAMQVTENMLQANKDVQAIFTASDGMLDGILQALANAGVEGVKIMSVDGSQKAVELIEAGEVTGTMAQFPQIMGGNAVEILLGVLDGSIDPDSIDKYIDSGTATYSLDNLDEAKENMF
ncbi:MAG TPA: sugar ABC transporter substrate-binding protein [Dysgonamonadaceae bacterium]|nr:sugar ABC transporter substrate-binding protein [Dysgonamonadaceae bacterium]